MSLKASNELFFICYEKRSVPLMLMNLCYVCLFYVNEFMMNTWNRVRCDFINQLSQYYRGRVVLFQSLM